MDRSLRFTPCLAALVLAACGGSGAGLDVNGRPITGTGTDTPLTADFQSIQDHVFTPICTQCHIGAAAPLGFRLDAGSSYAMLVNTPSSEVPSLLRVKPGDPDSSYIIQKLEGRAAVGAQMPLGQAPLPQSTIDIIRQWISEGATAAAQTATAASTKPRTFVRVVAPIEGETLTRSAGDPLFAADGQLDINSLNAASIAVVRSGGDGSFDDGNEVAVQGARFEIRAAQPTVFAVVLPRTERIPDTYRLTLRATGPAAVLDLGGNAAPADLILQYSIEDLP